MRPYIHIYIHTHTHFMKCKQPPPLKSDIKLCFLFLRRVINGAVIISARTSQHENVCSLLITALDIERRLMWRTCPEEIHSKIPVFNLPTLITLTQIRDRSSIQMQDVTNISVVIIRF